MTLRTRNIFAIFLGMVGTFQMAGYVVGSNALRGIGMASMIAPFPKVFSDVNGLETFASKFTFQIKTAAENSLEIPITPELYSQLKGPYNRRNVYGAALSYAPRLPQKIWEAVYCYGLRPGGPLREELGLPLDSREIRVLIETQTQNRSDKWVLEPTCSR